MVLGVKMIKSSLPSISSMLNVRIFRTNVVFSRYVWLGAKNSYEKRAQKMLMKLTFKFVFSHRSLWNNSKLMLTEKFDLSNCIVFIFQSLITRNNCIVNMVSRLGQFVGHILVNIVTNDDRKYSIVVYFYQS